MKEWRNDALEGKTPGFYVLRERDVSTASDVLETSSRMKVLLLVVALARTVAGECKDHLPINFCGALYTVSLFLNSFKMKPFRFCIFK